MNAEQIGKAINDIVASATIMILLIFMNFLLRRSQASIFGVTLPSRYIHLGLGPILVLLNSVLLIYLCALYRSDASDGEIISVQQSQKYMFLGFLFNPFYVSKNNILTGMGYAFLIFLWWIGMHSFWYSIGLNSNESPFLFGWQVLVNVLYLAVGLASMFAMQACWQKFGITQYQVKIWAAFVGIAAGALLPPIILGLGLPRFSD